MKAAAVALLAAVSLTGCAALIGTSDEPDTGQKQVDTQDAIDDALGVNASNIFYTQVIKSWEDLRGVASSACLTTLTEASPDPAAFNAVAAMYNDAQAKLVDLERSGPAGYPATVPPIDTSDWCSVDSQLAAAKG